MNSLSKILKTIGILIIVITIISAVYIYKTEVNLIVNSLVEKAISLFTPQPCSRPIQYSIGTIAPEFGMNKENIELYLKQAADVWETVIEKNLFEPNSTPNDKDVKINFIYDYRQKATGELASLGIVIKNDKNTYNLVKAKYDSLLVTYQSEKVKIQTAIDAYNQDKSAYNEQIQYWNNQGGAPKNQFQQLEQTRMKLNAEATALNDQQKTFNLLVDTLNSVVTVMNKLVNELKLNVKTYNTIGSQTGEEFSEGEYVSDATGTRINIYQFNDTSQLIRVLEHEFGHAIGLGHVDNSGAIMYRLNDGTSEKLTESDIAELKEICKMK